MGQLNLQVGSQVLPIVTAASEEVEPWFEDSFEGTPPKGWKSNWTEYGTDYAHDTTTEGGVPTGGGTYAYRQSWPVGQNTGGLWLYFDDVPGMPTLLGDGDEFYIHYYLKYESGFDFDNTSGFKQFIVQSDSETNDRMYHITIWGAWMVVTFQIANSGAYYYANVGGSYSVPTGVWVKFDWYVKVSPDSKKEGILKGWVNDVLRWDYSNIATIKSGSYYQMNLNYVFNDKVSGPGQNRYWDRFSIGPQ